MSEESDEEFVHVSEDETWDNVSVTSANDDWG